MAVPRFYHPRLDQGPITLSPAESAHARGPKRLRPGDPVTLFDGTGTVAAGVIADAPQHGPVAVRIDRLEHVPAPKPQIILATALPKGPRQDHLIEKCTELGADVIQPVLFQRSVVKPTSAKAAKWRRTALEACKQSARPRLPEIPPPIPFRELIAAMNEIEIGFYAHPAPDAAFLIHRLTRDRPRKTLLIAVGPEGGFAQDETAAMKTASMTPITLTSHILRTETAAVAAVALAAAWRHAPTESHPST